MATWTRRAGAQERRAADEGEGVGEGRDGCAEPTQGKVMGDRRGSGRAEGARATRGEGTQRREGTGRACRDGDGDAGKTQWRGGMGRAWAWTRGEGGGCRYWAAWARAAEDVGDVGGEAAAVCGASNPNGCWDCANVRRYRQGGRTVRADLSCRWWGARAGTG
jgi:hypothetical protein